MTRGHLTSAMPSPLLYCVCLFSLACYLSNVEDKGVERSVYTVQMEHSHSHKNTLSRGVTLDDFYGGIPAENLESGSYEKVYSYRNGISGFMVHTSGEMAEKLKGCEGIWGVVKERRVKLLATHTPRVLGLSQAGGVWQKQGVTKAGEGNMIGLIDSGINPQHPSFSNHDNSYPPLSNFSSVCKTGPSFTRSSCNGKIVTALLFAKATSTNSPLRHGSHRASTAAGNFAVEVRGMSFTYGRGSGMAPKARIGVYKVFSRDLGESSDADIVAAIDQAIEDRILVISISMGPKRLPDANVSILSALDKAFLNAHQTGIFVSQSAERKGSL